MLTFPSKWVLALAVLAACLPPPHARGDVTPGMTIDQSTAEQTKDLLPPEIYRHYQKGEYIQKVVDFPNSKFQGDDGSQDASEWNRQHLTLDAHKQPVDKDTGKRPAYITGQPFPDIREDDPDAGVK